MSEALPEQQASGPGWSLARYGTLVIVVIGQDGDDIECPDEMTAKAEFADIEQAMRAR